MNRREIMDIPHKNNLGQQTELVKKRLISYIWERHLKEGDKLPTQAELRSSMNVGSKTIQRAVHALQKDDVVELRGNSGVFLKNSDANGLRGHNIGLVCMRLLNYPFGLALLQCLEIAFHDHRCEITNFLRNKGPLFLRDSFDLYPGLKRSIMQHTVDILVSTVPLSDEVMDFCKKYSMPVCYYGDYSIYPNSVSFNSTTSRAFSIIEKEKFKRPAIFYSSKNMYETEQKTVQHFFQAYYGAHWQEYVFVSDFDNNHPPSLEEQWRDWDHLCERFLHIPKEDRPDTVYIPDDFLTTYFAEKIILQKEVLPKIITARVRQIPLGMPFKPFGWFQIDTTEIASLIAQLTLEVLKKSDQPSQTKNYTPLYFQAEKTKN